jgi:transposase
MAQPFGPKATINDQNISAAKVDHLPIVKHYAQRLGLVEMVNRLVPTQMEVEPGVIVLGMVLDTLSGRSPLYHLEEAFEDCDRRLLFGKELAASYFSDDNVGRVLELLYEVGTQKIFSSVSVAALPRFGLSTAHVHFDTTSVNLYGDYPNAAGEQVPFEITNGYSKDKRGDLKQFVLSMLCVGGDVPIYGQIEDGNASDKSVNHGVLSIVSEHMNTHGVEADAFIYVADSALVTEGNLEQIGDEIRFITRLPATYNECERVVRSAIETGQWQEIGRLAQSRATQHRPGASYRVHEGEVSLYDKTYRAIVVYSSAHDKRRLKRLERELKASEAQIEQLSQGYLKKRFFCRADAEASAGEAMAQRTALHQMTVSVQECPRYGPGRPKKDTPRVPVAVEYGLNVEISEDSETLAKRREAAGCFVLLNNVPKQDHDGYSAEKILGTYKEQHAIEKNYGFLKDDQIVNALFLKRPERIEALGLILLISLLIWRLIEHAMRTDLEQRNTTVPGWDNKPTQRPTAYMMTWKFKGILILCVGHQRRLAKPLTRVQEVFLEALHVPQSCFTQCPRAG